MFMVIFMLTFFVLPTTCYQGCYPACVGCKVNPVEFKSPENNRSVVIGAMFPVHYYSKGVYKLNVPGLVWTEAFQFAIEEINRDSTLLPDTKLGYRIHDSCNNVLVAIESALQLTQGFQNTTTPCNCMHEKQAASVALVGDASSSTSMRVAAVLSSTRTTQISYSATSTSLSMKEFYPSFLRTIPPDDAQAVMIADLMVHNNWTYINVVACDDQYGRVGMNELLPRLHAAKVCIGVQAVVDVKNDRTSTRQVVERIKAETAATVIILWCQAPEVIVVLQMVQNLHLFNRTWIATEAWGKTRAVFKYDKHIIDGTFGVAPLQLEYPPFVKHLKNVKPSLKWRNPWIDEYWNRENCKVLDGKYECPKKDISLYDISLSKHIEVINAVYSIAYGLHEYILQEKTNSINQERLFSYIQKVNFTGKNNLRVGFNRLGNPLVSAYSLTNVANGKWNIIASWDYHSRKFNFTENTNVTFAGGLNSTPQSSCHEVCQPGHYASSFQDSCCWKCMRCPINHIQPQWGQTACHPCSHKSMASENQTQCFVPEIVYIKLNSKAGFLLILTMVIGSVLVLAAIVVMSVYRNTPVVKASNTRLSALQLISMWFVFMLPVFVLQGATSSERCGAQLVYFMCFSAVTISVTFVKADRLLRIFNQSKVGRLNTHNLGKTNKIQYLTVSILTLIGFVLCLGLCFLYPIEIETKSNMLRTIEECCSGYYDNILFIVIGYLAVIALVCGIYAFKARKLPEGFNEARFTSFAMFVYLLSWLTFVPIHFSTPGVIDREAAWCFVSFFAMLGFLLATYYSKGFYIFMHREENTTERLREHIREFNTLRNHKEHYSSK